MPDGQNGDWPENRKYVLASLQNLEEQLADHRRTEDTHYEALHARINSLQKDFNARLESLTAGLTLLRGKWAAVGLFAGALLALFKDVIFK